MTPATPDSRLTAASLASGAKRHVKTLSHYPETCRQTFTLWRKRFASIRRVRGVDGSGPAAIAGTSAPFKSLKARLGHNLLRGSRARSDANHASEDGDGLPHPTSFEGGALFKNIPNPSPSLSNKRRVDWDAEDKNGNSKDATCDSGSTTATNKKSRLCGNSPDNDEAMPLAAEPVSTNNEIVVELPSYSSSASRKLALAKWCHPHTSPLGPQTSVYQRRSRYFSQPAPDPRKSSNSLAIKCLMQAFESDNRYRNPYKQTAQWCEDLHLTGLNDILHPVYNCEHPYHPSDPEYDEELDNDRWDEDEWSDSDGEDEVTTLSDGNDDQIKIISPADDSDRPTMAVDDDSPARWDTWKPSASTTEQCLVLPSTWEHAEDVNMQIVTN